MKKIVIVNEQLDENDPFIKCLKLLFPECDIIFVDQECIKECNQGKVVEGSETVFLNDD